MANVAVYNMEGKEVGSLELNDAIFGVEVNEHLVHMAVLQQLANNRQRTQKAKTRSEVSGGGRRNNKKICICAIGRILPESDPEAGRVPKMAKEAYAI